MKTLRCGKCLQDKPYTEFIEDDSEKTGWTYYCRSCLYKYALMGKKVCSICGKKKSQVHFRNFMRDGRVKTNPRCIPCERLQRLENHRKCISRKEKEREAEGDERILIVGEIKVCQKCGKKKAVSEFYLANGTDDGLFTDCKACCHVSDGKRTISIADDFKHYSTFFSTEKIT